MQSRSTKQPRWRTVTPFSAGMVAGMVILSLASCGEPQEQARTPAKTGVPFLDETIIAEVGDYVITAGELENRLQNQYTAFAEDVSAGGEKSIRNILRTDIDRLCVVAEAERTGYADSSRTYKFNAEGARRKVLQAHFIDEVIRKRAEPTEEELLAVYERNRQSYRINRKVAARHILVNTKQEAEAALARVNAGEDFADLAREVSLDVESHLGGGATGWVHASNEIPSMGLVPRFNEQVHPMKLGETKIVESSKGWHVVRIIREVEEALQPFEDVRDQIFDAENRRRGQLELENSVRDLRKRYGARLFDENLAAYLSWRRRAPEAELFTKAESETDPQERIRIYEEFLQKFSHSEHACKARFMIAFTYAEELPLARSMARVKLNEFLNECPDSDLAESARLMLTDLTNVKK